MVRQLRLNIENGTYHIFNRGNLKKKIFFDDIDYTIFLDLLFSLVPEYDIKIFSYSLMPNHFHLLLRTLRANISKFMQQFSTQFVQAIIKKHSLSGRLLTGRFKSPLIEEENYLLEVSRYIHLQSYKARMHIKPEEYKWSSFRNYLGYTSKYNVEIDTILDYFDSNRKKAITKYTKFVYERMDNISSYKLPQIKNGVGYGSEKYIKKVLNEANRRKIYQDSRKRRWEDLDDYEIAKLLLNEFYKTNELDMSLNLSSTKIKYSGIKISHIMIYILRCYTDLSFTEIGELIGGMRKSTVLMAYNRMSERIKSSSEIKGIIEKTVKVL